MIIQNGTVEFKLKQVQAIDPATGFPSKAEERWGEPIPCQFLPNSRNNLGRVNGEHFTTASYTVLLEEQPLPASEQLRLKDMNGTELGEFTLIAPPEPMDAVSEIKILI
jgi:hypothetical protein